jgi:YbbR domain-containing protein
MARATSGRFTQRLAVSDILLPPGIEPGDVRVVSPTSVNTRLDRLVTKRLRANVILSGSLPADLLFNRVPDASPIWVEVTGPESLVKPMDKVPTRPVELSRVRESVNREVPLDYDERSLTCVPDRVTVSISVSPRGTRVLANVPPTILMDEKDHLTDVVPNTVSLTLEGPQAVLDTLQSGDVSVLVDLSGKPPGRYRLAPEIIVPNGIENFVMDVDSLDIRISRASGS